LILSKTCQYFLNSLFMTVDNFYRDADLMITSGLINFFNRDISSISA